jgi:glycolate oxidase
MICYDERIPGQFARALEANEEILQACIELGGTVTGEHGVGLDKAETLALLFNQDDLEVMHCAPASAGAGKPVPAGMWV